MSPLIQELENIIANEKDVIPFLKKLTDADKKEIRPSLKKIKTNVFEEYWVESKLEDGGSSSSLKYTHSVRQKNIVYYTVFVCCTKTEIKKIFDRFEIGWLLSHDVIIASILPFYVPTWYDSLANEYPNNFDYETIMLLFTKGHINISDEMIINSIPKVIKSWTRENGKYEHLYLPEKLELYPETLQNHIWLFFEAASEIHNHYDFVVNGEHWWTRTFLNLAKEKKLDRQQLLKATILTAVKNFNRNLSGWFYDLLIQLEPTEVELLHHQEDLLVALQSPHSKILNTVLKYFKKLYKHKDFNYTGFLDQTSLLLNFETKSVVNNALALLENIAKTYPNSQTQIPEKVAEALIFKDEKIQAKAAKIINTYGKENDENLKATIVIYTENLFLNVKQLLGSFTETEEALTEVTSTESEAPLNEVFSEENKISTYHTFDELVFFMSQVLDENQTYDKDLLHINILKLQPLLTEDNVDNLEPLFQRVLKEITKLYEEYRPVTYFIFDFLNALIKKFPNNFTNTKKLITKNIKQLVELKKNRSFDKDLSKKLNLIQGKHSLKTFLKFNTNIYNSILLKSKSFLEKKSNLELLFIPTHKPCWILPETFIKRIIAFEEAKEPIDVLDFQLGIGRIPLHKSYDYLRPLINTIKDKEIQNVLDYHFGYTSIENCKMVKPEFWLQSVLIKKEPKALKKLQEITNSNLLHESASYQWSCEDESSNFSKIIFKRIKIKELKSKEENVIKNSLYSFDTSFDIFTNPNLPELSLADIYEHFMVGGYAPEVHEKEHTVAILQKLHVIWYRTDYGELTYLFVSLCFLFGHKVTRELAVELWVKGISQNTINTALLGQIIGKLEHTEYAPLKRFTDLVTQNLLNTSSLVNEELIVLFNNIILEMHDTPIKGVKKLLELYAELLQLQNAEIPNAVKEKLSIWNETKSLKPIIKKLTA